MAGRILRDAAAHEQAAGRHGAQREVPGFRAVRLDEHPEGFDAAVAATLERRGGNGRRRVGTLEIHGAVTRAGVRDLMNPAEPGAGHDILDLRAPVLVDQPAQQADLALVPRGEVRVRPRRRWDEAAADVVEQRFAQPRPGRQQADVAVVSRVPACST
jgi:hypothetical protein